MLHEYLLNGQTLRPGRGVMMKLFPQQGDPSESSETNAGVTGQRGDWMKRACEVSAVSSGEEMTARSRNGQQRKS